MTRAAGAWPRLKLERFCETDEVELRGGRECFGDIPAIESSAEAHAAR